KNTDIIGLSLGAFPKEVLKNDTTLTRTFGIRLEASLLAVLSPLMGISPISTNDDRYEYIQQIEPTEIIYGLNLSSGTFGTTKVHGCSSALLIQYLQNMNGISLVGMSNIIEKQNGFSASFLGNEIYKGNGILVGFGNGATYFNGLQLGGVNGIERKGIGLQIGVFNSAKDFRGIQLGLWNENDKRSFPIINWQFKG